jgi:hypothetical protein
MTGDTYTVYVTYMISSDAYFDTKSLGYLNSAYCNYIQKFNTDDIFNNEINFYFDNISDFKFLYNYKNISNADVYSINKLYAIIQILDNNNDDELSANNWRVIDVTEQISDYDPDKSITPQQITENVFSVDYNSYSVSDNLNLDYLNYPIKNDTGNTLSFGDETFFYGNIQTDIEAIAYQSEMIIDLPMGFYNSTTNPTWDGMSETLISEIGIYDENNNLVAIGKLNNPILKSDSISRNIVFSLDF